MVSRILNEDNDDATCPCCRLRASVARAILDPDNDVRHELLDQLLDTVESVRAFDAADTGDEQDAASMAAADAVTLVHMILDAGGEHLSVNQGEG